MKRGVQLCVTLSLTVTSVTGTQTDHPDLDVTSFLTAVSCLGLLVLLLGLCVFFKRRSFDIIQPDVGVETTAAFYQYRSQIQKHMVVPSLTRSDLGPRVSVVSLIPPDDVTESQPPHRHTSSLSSIAEEQCVTNGSAPKMVDLSGGFSVLAVPSNDSYIYTDDDYTTVDKVKRTARPPPVTKPSWHHRESIVSLDETDVPAVPPKTPESRVFTITE